MKKILCILCYFVIPVIGYSIDNPSAFNATPVSDTQIDLSWTLNTNNDSVIIAYSVFNIFGTPVDGTVYNVTDTIFGGGIIINKGISNLFNHTGLLPNTLYYYKIWSFTAGHIFSFGLVDSSKTLCTPAPSNFQEDFENGGNMPICWTQENISGNLNWIFYDGNPYSTGFANLPEHAFEGNFCAFFGSNSSTNNGNSTKLIMPPVDFSTTTGAATLGFWACVPSHDTLKVYYKTSYSGAWTLLNTANSNNGNWVNYILTLPNPSDDYYIAFEGTKSSTLKSGICIDKLWICRGSCCTIPSVSTISGSTSTCIGFFDQYSVTNVAGNFYYWSVSDGDFTSSQMGTNTYTPVFNSTGMSEICVTPENTCGYGETVCTSVCVSAGESITGSISGNPNPCIGSIQTYTITPTPSFSQCSFNWSVPFGWAINSGDGSTQINVTVGNGSGSVSFTLVCGGCAILCLGNGLSKNVSPITIPSQPSIITGTTLPCQSTSQTYSVTNVAGVAYTWTVPTGWTITSGQNTNIIYVTVGSTNGSITVTPSNICGSGINRTLAVSSSLLPLQPSIISGNNSPCFGTSQIYNINEVSGVSYSWSFPVGWVQTGGTTTDSVTVTVGSNNGNITVTPSNGCGNGTSSVLAVTAVSIPSQTSAIIGELSPCSGIGQIYSVINVNGVIYSWSFPTDWNQTGGGSTNEVTVMVGNDIGSITVTPSNVCGNGSTQTISVSPASNSPLNVQIDGDSIPCFGTSQNYSVISETGVTYTWIFPIGWTQTGGGNSDIISVITNSTGNIIVTPSNNCGIGNADSLFISVLPLNTFTQSLTVCAGQSITVGSNTHSTNGTYNDTLTSIVNGCDSIVTTNLTVLSTNLFTQSPTVCAGQSVTVGSNTYSISGTYNDVLTSIVNGCDSIVTTNLTVLTEIADSVSIVPATCGNNNGSVTVLPSGGAGSYTYLWSNNNTSSTITGLYGQPPDTIYVTITDAFGCSIIDTAIINCLTGISYGKIGIDFNIYPNPSIGIFTVFVMINNNYDIEIFNVLGECIYKSKIFQKQMTKEINILGFSKGIYLVKVSDNLKTQTKKIEIE
ncbi:MAG: T9SS type A sorting domain-containing protein [Bacteroidia bacterium]|nr:T9SS type A sorting domain-containing protein [Bacteroidia bacterium]